METADHIDYRVFLQGQCHALAYAMVKRYGYYFYAVGDDEGYIDHFAVMNAEGLLFDSRGWQTVDDFYDDPTMEWAQGGEIVDLNTFHNIVSENVWQKMDLELAEKYLDRLALDGE